MVGETWDFDVTHETKDNQWTCSTSNSEGSIVEAIDVNTANTETVNMRNDEGRKTSRISSEYWFEITVLGKYQK